MAIVEDALANTLRTMREHKGYTQTEVANQINTSTANISRWETPGNNGRTLSPTNLYQISNVYESTPSEIYNLASSEINLEDLAKKGNNNGNSSKNKSKKK